MGFGMFKAIFLLATLVSVPAPEGKPESECIELYPDDWARIVDCVSPPIDLEKNPKLRDFFAACSAAREAAERSGATLDSAVITVHGVTETCVTR